MIHRRPTSQRAAHRASRRRAAAPALPPAERLLAATARPVPDATATPRGEGLRVSRPLARPWWGVPPISWVVPVPKTKTVELDALGREVYEALEPGRTVESVIDAFAEHHRLPFDEARKSVSRFLELLLGRGMIRIDG